MAAARPCWPGSSGTIRIAAHVGRHPKVPAGWNIAARRSVTQKCYRADWGAVPGDQAPVACARYGLGAVGGAELTRISSPAASQLKMLSMEANLGSEPARLSSIQPRA
jgi:hypothetical protein